MQAQERSELNITCIMEEKIIVFKMLYQKLDTLEKRQKYIEGMGEEWEALQQSGLVYLDPRDYRVYDCILVDNHRWMAQDFAFEIGDAYQANDPQYTWENALQACPEGWSIPTRRDWSALINHACALIGIPAYYDWVDDYDSHTYHLLRCLGYDKKLGFYLTLDSYYSDHSVRYWKENQTTFYNHDGQNESHMGFSTAESYIACYLRPVQLWNPPTTTAAYTP